MTKLPAESAFCKGLSKEAQLNYFCIHLNVHPWLQGKLKNVVFSAEYIATSNKMGILLSRKKGKASDAFEIPKRRGQVGIWIHRPGAWRKVCVGEQSCESSK